MEVKQVIVARIDLNMSPGKLAAQVAHAAIGAFECARSEDITIWREFGVTKIVLQCCDVSVLLELRDSAMEAAVPFCLVSDAGNTEIEPGTLTCIGLGPAPVKVIDRLTGHLKLY